MKAESSKKIMTDQDKIFSNKAWVPSLPSRLFVSMDNRETLKNSAEFWRHGLLSCKLIYMSTSRRTLQTGGLLMVYFYIGMLNMTSQHNMLFD